jgi:hypothetical protein
VQNRFETSPGGPWSGWFGFGPAGTVRSIATGRHLSGQVELLAVMTDGSVMNKFETTPDGPWAGWFGWASALTINPDGAPGIINSGVHADGRVEFFGVTAEGGVQNRFETSPGGPWSGWYGFGPAGNVTSVSSARHASGQLEVFAVMQDGSIMNKFETTPGGPWTSWFGWAPAGTALG